MFPNFFFFGYFLLCVIFPLILWHILFPPWAASTSAHDIFPVLFTHRKDAGTLSVVQTDGRHPTEMLVKRNPVALTHGEAVTGVCSRLRHALSACSNLEEEERGGGLVGVVCGYCEPGCLRLGRLFLPQPPVDCVHPLFLPPYPRMQAGPGMEGYQVRRRSPESCKCCVCVCVCVCARARVHARALG